MNKTLILQKFELLFSKIPINQQQTFVEAFAQIAPATPESVIEWRKRLHFQEDGKIQAGAYLFVHDASAQKIDNWTEIITLFLENRYEETWKIMHEVLEAIENEMIFPYDFRMGISAYISENQGAFMFSFTALATPKAQEKYKKKYDELNQQFTSA